MQSVCKTCAVLGLGEETIQINFTGVGYEELAA